MDRQKLDHFKNQILLKIKEVTEQVNGTANAISRNERFADEVDESQHNTEVTIVRATHDRRIKHLKSLRAALKRIDTGDYGYCETCGYEIDEDRLELVLDADLCVTCGTLAFEKSRHQKAA